MTTCNRNASTPVIDNGGGALAVTFDDLAKGISHVSFSGTCGHNQVPDGETTVMLLGGTLTGVGLMRGFVLR